MSSAVPSEWRGDTLPLAPPIPETEVPEHIQQKCDRIILKAKLELMQHRFFGSMALTMKWRSHHGVPSYATDYKHIFYNPFVVVKERSIKVCAASLCHEVLHKIFRHNLRYPPRADPKLWNYACDFAINPVLVDEGWGFIKSADSFIYEQKYHGWSAEKIYQDLLKSGFKPPPTFELDIFAAPSDKDPGKEATEEEKQQMEIGLKSQVINAYESNKQYGLKSGNLKDLVKGLKKSYVDWRAVLQRKVIGDHPENYTWKRPNRRFLHQDIYMPSVEKFGVGDIYIWPDSSGSMSMEEMKSVASEMKYIIETIKPENVYVVELDASIHGIKHFPKGSTPEGFDFKGRGGTDPKPFFEYCNKQSSVHCAICLTDMGFDYNIPRPSYTTLWISTTEGAEHPNFGTMITIPVKP